MTRMRLQDDPKASLLERFCHNLAVRCRVADDRLLVAVSGGSDSVALLRLLLEARPRLGFEIVVAHFDHRLRPESEDDARFVRDLAGAAGLRVEVGAWATPRPGEAAARAARHAFLQQRARTLGCTALVFGHQLDDQVETVLLRLGRGSGPRGLGGMPWRRRAPVVIVRPLLDCRRDELIAYLEGAGQRWRCDASNIDLARARNRVRHLVLPALDATFDVGWRERWSAAFTEQRELTEWLQRTTARTLARARRGTIGTPVGLEALDLAALRRLAAPRLRAALQIWLDPLGTRGFARPHLLQAAELVRNGRNGQRFDLPRATLRIEADKVVCERHESAPEVDAGSRVAARLGAESFEPPTFELEVVPIDPRAALEDVARSAAIEPGTTAPLWFPTTASAVISAVGVSPPFAIRSGAEGERVRLLGATGSRPLRRILQDRHVPPRLRRDWPVVTDTRGIVWIPEVGVAERCRLDHGSSQALRLRLREAANHRFRLAEVHDET